MQVLRIDTMIDPKSFQGQTTRGAKCSIEMEIFQIWVWISAIYQLTLADHAAIMESHSYFHCGNGTFIDSKEKCNGVNDCGNWDDECDCTDKPDSLCRKQPCLSGDKEIRRRQMCDGSFDCPDLSDECLCDRKTEENEWAFKICDMLLHYIEGQCCIGELMCASNSSANQCISGKQICDGTIDCANGMDERLCGHYYAEHVRNKSCDSSSGDACACDGRVDLPDGMDERNCQKYFYCNNDTQKYSTTFAANSSRTMFGDIPGLYIDWRRRFDGVKDCDDAMDEWHPDFFYCFATWAPTENQDCNQSNVTTSKDFSWGMGLLNNCSLHPEIVLSSSEYFIKSRGCLVVAWIIGIVAIVTNGIVIIRTVWSLMKRTSNSSTAWSKKANQAFVLNLAVCDFILGVITVLFCVLDAISSGNYWKYSRIWAADAVCITMRFCIVTIAHISMITLVNLTWLRLFTVLQPFKKLPLKVMVACLLLSWIFALVLSSFMVMSNELLSTAVSIPNLPQVDATMLEKGQVREIVRRAITLSKISKTGNPAQFVRYRDNMSWDEMEKNMTAINAKFGNWKFSNAMLHSQSCIPQLIFKVGEPGWKFTCGILGIGTALYIFMAVSYLVILKKTTSMMSVLCLRQKSDLASKERYHEPGRIRNSEPHREKEDRLLQQLIFAMIIVNFFCWFPITVLNIMNFFDETGSARTTFTKGLALILLLINSAANPFFYSRFIRKTAYCILVSSFKEMFTRIFRGRLKQSDS